MGGFHTPVLPAPLAGKDIFPVCMIECPAVNYLRLARQLTSYRYGQFPRADVWHGSLPPTDKAYLRSC